MSHTNLSMYYGCILGGMGVLAFIGALSVRWEPGMVPDGVIMVGDGEEWGVG